MLELEKYFGEHSDIEDLRMKNRVINQIMNTTINSAGDGVIINTGSQSKITANISIKKGDKGRLKERLEAHLVSRQDVDELLAFIDAEPAKGVDIYGSQVMMWMSKMISKAIDGSWQVGIGAAGSIVSDAIAEYHGLK